jgi:SNF family Na+-dependent transporter
MKHWILEKEGQLKLFSILFFVFLFASISYAQNPYEQQLKNQLKNYEIQLAQATRQGAGISLLISAPLIVLFAQLCLAIREIALNTRKEFNSETEYKILQWTALIISFIGFCLIPIGIVLIISSL